MQNNIEMERIWQDEGFWEMNIICTAETVTASANFYVTDRDINDLSHQIKIFADGKSRNNVWRCGTRDNGTTPCISLGLFKKDLLGHVLIEVFMELDDGGPLNKHHCCFFVQTEIGTLYEFGKNLCKLKQKQIGQKVSLYEEL